MGVVMRNSHEFEIHLFRKLSGDGSFHLSTEEACDWINQDFIPVCKEMFDHLTGIDFVIGKLFKSLV